MRNNLFNWMLYVYFMCPLIVFGQSQDSTNKFSTVVGPSFARELFFMRLFNPVRWVTRKPTTEKRLFIEGNYEESLKRSKQSLRSADKFTTQFYELIALNEIALDNYLGADSALKALLREDINYTPSDIAKDDTFDRMFSSYTIKPRLVIGFLGNRLSPFFRNVKRVSIHEDYDYSQSLELVNPSYGLGALIYFNWKHLSIGNESTWNNLKIERSIVHSSGTYQSQLNEQSRFFNSKIVLLYDFSLPFALSRKNKIPPKLSVGPSLTFMKLRSSDGSITSSIPVYSFTADNSFPTISSNETNTARVDLASTRNKSNWLMGWEAKLWFFMFKKYWIYSWSYQIALRDYTSEQLSLGNEVLFNSYYVDSPTRLRCFQMSLAYYIPMRPQITSAVLYE